MANSQIIQIDRESCIGSGNCVEIAPSSFAIDVEGVANFTGGADPKTVEAAVNSCPVAAIVANPAELTSPGPGPASEQEV